jgi:DNA mismatch repair protein MutS2
MRHRRMTSFPASFRLLDRARRSFYACCVDLDARTLEALDWPFLTQELARHARTSAGARAAAAVDLAVDPTVIHGRLDEVEEVLALTASGDGSPPVGGVEDVAELLRRCARGEVLDLPELRACRATIGALTEVLKYFRERRRAAPVLAQTAETIELEQRLCATMHAALDERGELSERTYPVLAELRRRIASLERRVRSTLEELLGSPELADHLQDRYVTLRADRFVLPIKAQAKSSGLGIVHDASRTGQTVFIEPHQVVPLNNERRIAETELAAEERRIRADLSALIGRHEEAIGRGLDAATVIDLACARAELSRRLAAVRPAVKDRGELDLRAARHPILALGGDVVANDLCLGPKRPVLVLTGPNAGGKTVALKTIGLCALLVRAGCFVPAAAGSRVDVFADIAADIGDQQTVHAGLSSFSGHLTTLRSMLERSREGSLLLLDEIASGTDPTQGGALARALIERFAESGARVVATTHYAQVKAMGSQDGSVEVAALEYRDGKPTYRVVPGVAGESHALAAAARVGIDAALIARARTLMDEGERALQDAVIALEAERARSEELSRQAKAAADSLALRERAVEQRELKVKLRAREMEEETARAFVERTREAEREVRRIVAELQRAPSQERAAQARATIAELGADIARHVEPQRAPVQARVGDRVRIPKLGSTGEVVSIRDGEAEVRAGAVMVRVRLDEIEAVQTAAAAPAPARTRGPAMRTGRVSNAQALERLQNALRVPANTLDLRGVRVEEGLARLEAFLDAAMLQNHDTVFVLHGHGTGALRSAIRKALADSPYVAAAGAAAPEQGGDAFTVAVLRG